MRFTNIPAVILLCLLSSMAGCGGGSSSNAPPAGPNNPAPPAPTPPALPASILAEAGDGEVTVKWLEERGVTYTVYWSTVAGLPLEDRTAVEGLTTRFLHSGLSNGTTYYYVVTAVRDGAESAPSLEYQALPAPGMTVGCNHPDIDTLVGVDDEARCFADSTFEVARVSVRLGGNEVVLEPTPPPCDPVDQFCGLRAPLPVAGLPFGPVLVVVTATDVLGTTVQDSFGVIHDELPVAELSEPLDYEVARPSLRVRGSCEDDDPTGCARIRIGGTCESRSPELAEVEGDSIDEPISFAPVDGCKVTLYLEGFDSRGQRAERPLRTVFVESSERLLEVAHVSGRIWDVDADRVLFVEGTGDHEVLKIRDRAFGTDEVVVDDAETELVYGFLAPRGAIFVAVTPESPSAKLFDWRDQTLLVVDEPNSSRSLETDGDYAIWHSGASGVTLTRRDLRDGTNVVVTNDAGNGGADDSDVASDGDVVYWDASTFDIFRFDGTTLTRLTDDPDIRNSQPITDGTNVVYSKTMCCGPEFDGYTIAVHDGTTETILSSEPREDFPSPDRDYAIIDGWIAFTDVRPNAAPQVHVRALDGSVTQAAFFTEPSEIDALGADGKLALTHDGRRYVTEPPYAGLTDVSSDLRDGPLYWSGDSLAVVLGRYLFEIIP